MSRPISSKQYAALAKRWDSLMYEQNCGEWKGQDLEKLNKLIIDVERQMEAAPWQFDDDGNVVPRAAVSENARIPNED